MNKFLFLMMCLFALCVIRNAVCLSRGRYPREITPHAPLDDVMALFITLGLAAWAGVLFWMN